MKGDIERAPPPEKPCVSILRQEYMIERSAKVKRFTLRHQFEPDSSRHSGATLVGPDDFIGRMSADRERDPQDNDGHDADKKTSHQHCDTAARNDSRDLAGVQRVLYAG